MQDKESSILWIIRCITALLLMRRQLGKSFKDANKEDTRLLLKWMDDKNYKGFDVRIAAFSVYFISLWLLLFLY
jgi:hypothetical protein